MHVSCKHESKGPFAHALRQLIAVLNYHMNIYDSTWRMKKTRSVAASCCIKERQRNGKRRRPF